MTIPKKAKEYKPESDRSTIIEQGTLPAGYLEERELSSLQESHFNGTSQLNVAITKHGIVVGDECESRYSITYEALDSLLAHCKKVVK